MIWLIVISALLIAAYTVAVCLNERSIPSSISATFYTLEQKWWFCVTMVATAFMLLPYILEVTPDYQFTAFLACVGMVMTGVAPHFKEGIEKKIHTAGAVLCLVFSQVWVALTCPWVLLVWVGYLVYTAIGIKRNWNGYFIGSFMATKPMFWLEITALLTTYVTLLIV